MTDERDLRQFAGEMDTEVAERVDALGHFVGHTTHDAALAEICIEYLEEAGVVTDAHLCPYGDEEGRKRSRITGYAIPEGAARLDLFVAQRAIAPMETFPRGDLRGISGRAARFFEHAAKKDFERFRSSPETLEAARRIHSLLSDIETVRVHVFTDGLVGSKDVQDLEIQGFPVEFSVYDLERLFRLSKSTTARSDIVVDFVELYGRPLPCLETKPRPEEYETYLAVFNGELLFKLYEQYGQQLFEFNVRSFLQAKGKVNLGIRETLRKHPERFMAYNNGLVATVDEIEIGLFHGETAVKRLVGLQIVNGAQTTASIHRAKKQDKLDVGVVSVPVKITKVQPDKLAEFVPLISRFANTQNNIQVSDLSANHEFHIELERLSNAVWAPGEESRWFYERARGAYQVAYTKAGTTAAQRRRFKEETPSSQKITKTELARDLMVWLGRPHTVSLGAQKNFAIFMAELPDLYPKDWKPDEDYYRGVVSRAILFRGAEKVVRAEKFPAYRPNIAAYLVAYLAHICRGELDFSMVWDAQGVSDDLKQLLVKWSHQIDRKIRETARGRNVTEWCKSVECWDAVRSLDLPLPDPLPPELAAQEKDQDDQREDETGPSSPEDASAWDDEERIEACMRLDAATWARISAWGITTGRLTRVERGVAHTLSEYAAAQWSRRPSLKQARVGARALDIAREEGILPAGKASS